MGKDCPNGNISKSNLVHYDFHKLRNDKNGTCAIREICSPRYSTRAIWVPKHLVTNPIGPNKCWVPRSAYWAYRLKRCIERMVGRLRNLDGFNWPCEEQTHKNREINVISDLNKWYIHSLKEKGRKITKMLSSGGHLSDRWQAPVWPVPTQQVQLGGWPGTSARVTRYASVCCRVTQHECPGDPRLSKPSRRRVIWRRRLWEVEHNSINKSFMCCDQVWNEPHRVLNWTKCLDREIQNL
jgi:hypothetical protein